MSNGSKSYWLYGLHAGQAALANPSRTVRRALVNSAGVESIRAALSARKLAPELKTTAELDKLLGAGSVHQGIALEVMPLESPSLHDLPPGKPLLLLDQVTDPHNVGAILRSAAAFGAGAVIAPKDHAAPETAALAKAASGALELVPYVIVTNLSQTIETLKKQNYWCVGLDGEAKQTLQQAKLKPSTTALVLGAEGKGLRRLTAERCDLLVRLPITALMESLNVSNAAAVALYELSREN